MEAATEFSSKAATKEDHDHQQQKDQDGDWQKVQKKKKTGSGYSSGGSNTLHGKEDGNMRNTNTKPSILDRMSMSFFITNFPKHITAKDIWNRCLLIGAVVDVFIPDRLSKARKRFGFVRFIKVDNAKKLLENLRSVWFGNFLMFADFVKYSRNTGLRKEEPHQKIGAEKKRQPFHESNNSVGKKIPNKSFADAVVSNVGTSNINTGINTPAAGNIFPIPTSRRSVKVYSPNVDSDKVSRSTLVKVRDASKIPLLGHWLQIEGFSDFVISYVGGRWIHVIFNSIEAKNLFVANDNLKCRFCAFKVPCNSFVPDERLVWVEIAGLPFGAWQSATLQDILEDWGKCIFFANDWEDAYSMCKVCVLTQSSKYIYEELSVKLEDQDFDIWIREFAVWEPKILKSRCDYSSSSDSGHSEDMVETSSVDDDDEGTNSETFDSDLCKDKSDDQFVSNKDNLGGFTSRHEVNQDYSVNDSHCNSSTSVTNNVNRVGVEAEDMFVPEAQVVKEANQERINELIAQDIFSLDRIIEKEAANHKRARSCPPSGRYSGSSSSSGAPGLIKGQFLATDNDEKVVSLGDSITKTHHMNSADSFESSLVSSNMQPKILNYDEMGNKMGLNLEGDTSDIDNMVKRISVVDGLQ